MSKKLNSIPLAMLVLTLILATSGCAQPKAAGPAGVNLAVLALNAPPQFQPPVSTGAEISIGPCDPVTDVCGDHIGRDLYAIDYIGPEGTPVGAALAGEVVYSGYSTATTGQYFYGWVVTIRHSSDQLDKNYYSIYAHLSGVDMPALGAQVGTGAIIGYMSNSGVGPGNVHLHFAVRSSDSILDGDSALFGGDAFNVRAQFNLDHP